MPRHRAPRTKSNEAIRGRVASIFTEGRRRLGLTKAALARRTGISPQMVGEIESGRANPSIGVVVALLDHLGLDVDVVVRRGPVLLSATPRQQDAAHAMCSGYVERRLRDLPGWEVRREVRVDSGRYHGWIDILAFHAGSGTLLIIEIKTRLDDLGGIERSMDWYVRETDDLAKRLGWRVHVVVPWLLVLATDEVEDRLRASRSAIDEAFPERAGSMAAILADPVSAVADRSSVEDRGDQSFAAPRVLPRGVALFDPRSRRHIWLTRSRIDGRRRPVPYRDYAAFMRAAMPAKGQG